VNTYSTPKEIGMVVLGITAFLELAMTTVSDCPVLTTSLFLAVLVITFSIFDENEVRG
jgi:hypothetical protein